MPISFRRPVFAGYGLLVPAFLLCLLSLPASQALGQDPAAPITPLQKQLDRIDFAIGAAGEIGTTVSGIEQRDATTTHSLLTIKPSSTVGELITLRYTAKPYVGFEFNFGNLRYTQDYTFVPAPSQNLLIGGAQSGVRELTLGYVAHLPFRPMGVTPYVGIGGGTIRFKPTTGGGQGLPQQYRAAYYYEAGLEDNFPSSHFGMRLGFRQLIYLAPDFLQNYLTITRRVRTSEPTIGFFVRF
jgi:opacity protein-like surface antigen